MDIRQLKAIHLIAAARPNFMKVAPLYHAIKAEKWCNATLVHTGQHYDENMSGYFFRDLGLPEPEIHLGVGSGTHAEQTGGVMIAYEKVCLEQRPDMVVVVGDVNSTLACTLAAKKLHLPVAHLEAGLRSGDRTMPEEINRIVTDSLADILWTPSPDADDNLGKEGVNKERVKRVGNIMIDSYEMLKSKIEAEDTAGAFGLVAGSYAVVTLHRPVNVDSRESLKCIVSKLEEISETIPLVFPVHPRTSARLNDYGLLSSLQAKPDVRIVESLNYVRFLSLVKDARLIITDSGGIQEETTYLNIPCLTLRETTERPITITQGTNQLVSVETLVPMVRKALGGNCHRSICPELWDGKTASRVLSSLKDWFRLH